MTSREFQREYERLLLPLGMYALRITESVDDAEDCVQSAFAAAWKAVSDGFDPHDFKAYMYGAVRNAAIDFVRRAMPSRCLDESDGNISDEAIDTSERDAKIWRAVDELPPQCRTILLMAKRDGMRQAEIAEELGISVKTVENQLAKAMSRLRGQKDLRILMFML